MLQYLLVTNSVDNVAGNVNFDLLKVWENNLLLNHFMEHVQIVNKPTYISGPLIDHVYIKKTLMEEFFANATVKNIYFSDHDYYKNCNWEKLSYPINYKPDVI